MNQEKTGAFLKVLRKERNLTQEELAEHFNVTGRSVSRWETGRNMPDISILVELSEFYDVDIREIIDGERKSENMNEDVKDSILKVAEYADNEKGNLAKRIRIISFLGMGGFLVNGYLSEAGMQGALPVLDFLRGMGAGLTFATLLVMILYTTGILNKMVEKKMICSQGISKKVTAVVLIMAMGSFILALLSSF